MLPSYIKQPRQECEEETDTGELFTANPVLTSTSPRAGTCVIIHDASSVPLQHLGPALPLSPLFAFPVTFGGWWVDVDFLFIIVFNLGVRHAGSPCRSGH